MSPVRTGSVMREEGVTFTEQAAGTRVWWKSKSKPEVWLADLDPPQRPGLFFPSADPSTKTPCVKKEPFPFAWRPADCTTLAGRERPVKTFTVACVRSFVFPNKVTVSIVLRLGFVIYGSCRVSLQQSVFKYQMILSFNGRVQNPTNIFLPRS